jgi:cell wall-associated NlpC family hydrolase
MVKYDMDVLKKFIQIPFKDMGRDFNGCDCLGLVTLFYKEVFGITIQEFGHSCYNISAITDGFKKEVDEWEPVNEPEFGCIIAMNNIRSIPNVVNHIGIYIGNNEILHIKPQMCTIREDIRSSNFLKIMGYYVFKTA